MSQQYFSDMHMHFLYVNNYHITYIVKYKLRNLVTFESMAS